MRNGLIFQEMMLNDFFSFVFCLHNEGLIVKVVSGKCMWFAYPLIGLEGI